MEAPALSLGDHVCLALIDEGPIHGWAIVKLLAPDGDLGRVWSLSRPLTYRAIDRLAADELIARRDLGRRTELRTTPTGRRAADEWLAEPVEHLRDLRTEFLLKLRLLERRGAPPSDLVDRQVERLEPVIDALTATPAEHPVDLWRHESARAAQRFLRRIGDDVVCRP